MPEGVVSILINAVTSALPALFGWLSQKGRVTVTVTKWERQFTEQDGEGGFEETSTKEDAVLYSYALELDLYNSSNEIKVIRDIKLSHRGMKINIR